MNNHLKKRKRFRCKACKKRINVIYNIDKIKNRITFICPCCGTHGDFKIVRRI